MNDKLNLMMLVLRHAKGADPVTGAELRCELQSGSPVFQVVLETKNQLRATGWFSTPDAAFANAESWEVVR